MNASQTISKQGLKWKCKEHPNVPCELICLNEDAKQRVVCFNCVQKYSIPISNVISMSYVLAANENEILQAYPPLKDQELSNKLKDTNLQQPLKEIEDYFKKLRDDFDREVQAALQRAKNSFIRQEKVGQQLLEGYMRSAEVEKLKELIVSDKESAEKDLDYFIKEKWNKAEENKNVLENLISKYETEECFSSDESNRIAKEIIQSLKNINFFQQSIEEPQFTLIRSSKNQAPEMEISKVNNQIYQVRKQYFNDWDEVFIDPILNPEKKYILQIELEQKHENKNNAFFFGLVKDEEKDNNTAFNQSMCYYDNSYSYGISKYIKGTAMQSGDKEAGKHSFEIRIYLNQKFLRVACLPDYSSIAELDDQERIDPKVAYRFFLSMYYTGDMMRITNFRIVSEFDENM